MGRTWGHSVTGPSRHVVLELREAPTCPRRQRQEGGQSHCPLCAQDRPRLSTMLAKRKPTKKPRRAKRSDLFLFSRRGSSSSSRCLTNSLRFLPTSFLLPGAASVRGPLTRSLLVEVDGVSETRLHLWYLVADDLHQHFGELHLQGLRLAEGVEAEVQQASHQLDERHSQHLHSDWLNTLEYKKWCDYPNDISSPLEGTTDFFYFLSCPPFKVILIHSALSLFT